MTEKTIDAPRHGFKLAGTTPEDWSLIEAYLRSVNGRSTANVKTSFAEVDQIAELAESELDRARVSKSARVGCIAYQCDGGAAAKSYKYSMQVTGIRLQRFAEGWRLMSATRMTSRPQEPDCFYVKVPARYIEEMKRRAVEGLLPLSEKQAA